MVTENVNVHASGICLSGEKRAKSVEQKEAKQVECLKIMHLR